MEALCAPAKPIMPQLPVDNRVLIRDPAHQGGVGALELILCSRTQVLSIITIIGREPPLAFLSPGDT